MGSLSDYYGNREGGNTETDQPAETAGSTPSSPTGTSVDLSPAATSIASQAANFGLSQTPMSSIPGIGGAVGGAVNAGINGGTATQVGQSAISGGIASLLQNALPGVPALPSMIGSAAAEMLSEDPQPAVAATRAGISSAGALIGSAIPVPVIGPMVGSAIANHYGNMSIEDGYLGDALDSRSREAERDAVEQGMGQSVGSTKGMAAADRLGMAEREDGYGFGLSANYGATTEGQLSKAAKEALGTKENMKTLSSYYSSRMSSEEKTNMESSRSGQDSNGGRDNGNDTGHDGSGARGGGNEGNSSPGGIGGY